MTSKEAWEQIKNFIFELRKEKYIDYKAYTDIVQKLVERDTPFKVKPILVWCKCSSRVYPDENFCKECGQRLDWSEY